ncbi:hypothetical protein PF005_g27015, partial [Phytophthora fragariae]
ESRLQQTGWGFADVREQWPAASAARQWRLRGGPSVHPVNGGVEIGAVETEASITPVPPDTTPTSKKQTRDAADVMEEVMDKAVKAVREASRREFEEYIKHPEYENKKTRALLRELFGGN